MRSMVSSVKLQLFADLLRVFFISGRYGARFVQ